MFLSRGRYDSLNHILKYLMRRIISRKVNIAYPKRLMCMWTDNRVSKRKRKNPQAKLKM